MKQPIHVIKLGGRSLEGPDAVADLARDAAAVPGRLVFVHGGGADVSAWCRRLGVEPRFINGLRVTDPETLEVATAVLAGLSNKRLVAGLQDAGLNAVGISAVDGGLLVAGPPPHPELGAVAGVASIDTNLIELLLEGGFVPVVASIGGKDGALVNVNADDVAAALAAAVGAQSLHLLTDVAGLRLDGSHVASLSERELAASLDHPDVAGGMRPKLEAAHTALRGGVPVVRIGAWDGPGTLVDLVAGLGAATTIHMEYEESHHDLAR